jgi:hypothetical protein
MDEIFDSPAWFVIWMGAVACGGLGVLALLSCLVALFVSPWRRHAVRALAAGTGGAGLGFASMSMLLRLVVPSEPVDWSPWQMLASMIGFWLGAAGSAIFPMLWSSRRWPAAPKPE